jgi:ribosomal protein L32
MKSEDLVPCPHCGEEIRRNARACPHCGSDESTGWSERNYLNGIDLPEDVDYEELRDNEFGNGLKKTSNKTWLFVTGAIVLMVFLLGALAVLR